MAKAAQSVEGITFIDLYAEYPRFNIRVDIEQERLSNHDIVVFQFPMFWYSTPSILKEWQDIVLEHGWAYGQGGTRLSGKRLLAATTAGGSEEAYSDNGYQRYPIRTFLTPLERTAGLCQMAFLAPYVLFGAIRAVDDGRIPAHVTGYVRLLQALRDDQLDLDAAAGMDTLGPDTLPLKPEAVAHG